MDPGWVIWKVTWSEITNRCEIGASDGVFLGKFQLDPGSEMWRGFNRENSNGPWLGDLEGDWVGKYDWV